MEDPNQVSEADEVVAAITGNNNPASVAEKKKKKKKKNKKPAASTNAASAGGEDAPKAAIELLSDRKMLEKFADLDLSTELKESRTTHPFWTSQPVLTMKEAARVTLEQNEPVERKTLADVRKEPLDLPEGFEWVEVSMS